MITVKNISALSGMVALLFLFFSLFSYHVHDPSFLYYTSQQSLIHNWCGSSGAQVAALLFYMLGKASFLLLGACILGIYLFITQKRLVQEWDRIGASIVMIFAGALYYSMHKQDGGYIGTFLQNIIFCVADDVLIMGCVYTVGIVCVLIMLRSLSFIIMHTMYQRILFIMQPHRLAFAYCFLSSSISAGMRAVAYLFFWLKNILSGSSLEELDQSMLAFEYDFIQENEEKLEQERKQIVELLKQKKSVVENDMPMMQERVQSSSMQDALFFSPTHTVPDSINKQISYTRAHNYHVPHDLLMQYDMAGGTDVPQNLLLEQAAHILQEKLERFGIAGKVTSIKQGSVVTLFEYQPEIDTKISKILALEDDLGMALQAHSIRIIAPIPGRSVIGFEVSNAHRTKVHLSRIIISEAYRKFRGLLPLVLGENTVGDDVIVDLATMPHVLVAGSTGSGKSVCLNTMLISLLYKQSPDNLKLILIDPKRLEFTHYIDIPHLLFPIITQSLQAIGALRWVVQEMERRYQVLASCGVRSIYDYQQLSQNINERMPFIIIMIDEFADLVMTSQGQVEDLIIRIAQMARAAGIHLMLATQRPSADVITGLIKVNIPSRISFRVSSKVDSRIILDSTGAEKLLGYGDMLFLDPNTAKIDRIHGAYISDQEIMHITRHIRSLKKVQYHDLELKTYSDSNMLDDHDHQLYQEIVDFVQTVDEVSISLLQRKFKIGYNRSARIIDMLESQGFITSLQGSKVRKVIR